MKSNSHTRSDSRNQASMSCLPSCLPHRNPPPPPPPTKNYYPFLIVLTLVIAAHTDVGVSDHLNWMTAVTNHLELNWLQCQSPPSWPCVWPPSAEWLPCLTTMSWMTTVSDRLKKNDCSDRPPPAEWLLCLTTSSWMTAVSDHLQLNDCCVWPPPADCCAGVIKSTSFRRSVTQVIQLEVVNGSSHSAWGGQWLKSTSLRWSVAQVMQFKVVNDSSQSSQGSQWLVIQLEAVNDSSQSMTQVIQLEVVNDSSHSAQGSHWPFPLCLAWHGPTHSWTCQRHKSRKNHHHHPCCCYAKKHAVTALFDCKHASETTVKEHDPHSLEAKSDSTFSVKWVFHNNATVYS